MNAAVHPACRRPWLVFPLLLQMLPAKAGHLVTFIGKVIGSF